MSKVRALYDFEADDEEEISFEVGEIIEVTMKDDETEDGWWKGKTANGQEGYFPRSYVEPFEGNEENREEKKEEEKKEEKVETKEEIKETKEKDLEQNKEETKETKEEANLENIETLQFARDIEEEEFKRITVTLNELTRKPTVRETLEKQLQTWQINEEQEFLQQKEKLPETTEENQIEEPNFDFQSKSPESWTTQDVCNWLNHRGFSEFSALFKEHEIYGEALLEIDHDDFRDMNVKSIGKRIKLLHAIQHLKESEPHLDQELKGLSYGISTESLSRLSDSSDDERVGTVIDKMSAIADFHSDKKEELTFKKGDTIKIIEKTSPEWWRGEFNGKIGIFPRSHVVPLNLNESETTDDNRASISESIVLSAIDAVSPEGVKSAKNRKVSQKEIHISQKKSKQARPKRVIAPVPQITASEIVRPNYQGWLTKQGGSVKTWRRRWFVLKDHCLYYFKDIIESPALGCIILPSYTMSPAKEIHKPFAFKAVHPGARSYFFIADSEAEMNLWIKALTKASLPDENPIKTSPQNSTPSSAKHSSEGPESSRPSFATDSNDSPKSKTLRKAAPLPPTKQTQTLSPSQSQELQTQSQLQPQSQSQNEQQKEQQNQTQEIIKTDPEPETPSQNQPQTQSQPQNPIETPSQNQPQTQNQNQSQPQPQTQPQNLLGLDISSGLQALKSKNSAESETVYVEWLNSKLELPEPVTIENLCTIFQDSFNLIKLLESLSQSSVGKYKQNAKMRPQIIENLDVAIHFMKSNLNLNMGGINAEALCNGDKKVTLLLLGTLKKAYP